MISLNISFPPFTLRGDTKDHFALEIIMKNESCSVMSNSWWPHGLYSSWNSPGQNTGVGSCSFLQGIFPTLVLNSGIPHCRGVLYHLGMSMCRVFFCVVGRGCLVTLVHFLGKTLLVFALLHSIFQSQIFLLLQVFLDFYFCIPVPYNEKDIFFGC